MKRVTLSAVVAASAALALAVIPSAATAHTDNLYTWAFFPDADPGLSGFATTSKTDAALTLLPTNTDDLFHSPTGTEVCNEVGYAVGDFFDDEAGFLVWDHESGALIGAIDALWTTGGAVREVWELDTLADCTILTIGALEGPDVPSTAVLSINLATHSVDVVVDLSVLDVMDITGLATDPTGVTYLFAVVANYPHYAVLDLAAGTAGEWQPLTSLSGHFESTGFTLGVDFDASGVLWAVTGVNNEEAYHLVSLSGPDLGSATVTDAGILPYSGDGLQISEPIPLTAEHAPSPQLADTGAEAPAGVILGAGVFLLGGPFFVALRRRAA